MKITKAVAASFSMLAIATSINAYSQTAASASNSEVPMASSSAATNKATKAANRKLGKVVRRALSKSKDINASNISVRANGGVVTLAGTVPEQAQIDKAGTVAQQVTGVTSVKNALTIRSVGQ
jgi:hyperosmotically inducible periplasmic protein